MEQFDGLGGDRWAMGDGQGDMPGLDEEVG